MNRETRTLGPLDSPLGEAGSEATEHDRTSKSQAGQSDNAGHTLQALADREWNDLPYAMMRLTGNQPPNQKRFYWRDLTLFLGEAQLNLARVELPGKPPRYSALYLCDGLKEDVTVSPVLEGSQLRWLAPALAGSENLRTQDLIIRMLSRLRALEKTISDSRKQKS